MPTFDQAGGNPLAPDALFALGVSHESAGRWQEAAATYRNILAVCPDAAEVYNNLANVVKVLGNVNEAVVYYERALALRPDLVQVHHNFGCLLQSQGQLDRALTHFERVLELAPNLAEGHFNLGNVLKAQGRLDLAIEQFRQALARKAGYAEAHHNLANVLRQLGKFEEASQHYEQALAVRPDLVESHFARSELKKYRPGDPDLAALEELAANPNRLPPARMVHVHFALGKALDDVGEHSRAFEQWLRGNALKRRQIQYDESAYRRTMQSAAEQCDARLLARLAGAGDPSSTPIFVLGMPRSGSTLIAQILASHPRVMSAGELGSLDRVVNGVTDRAGRAVPFPACLALLEGDRLGQMAKGYLASLPTPPAGKDRVVDKTPGNFLHVGLIHAMFPGARIIHSVRNPIDTCVSCFSRLFTTGIGCSYDLAELGRYYRWYEELMEHWRSVLPADAMLEVSYEQLVDNFEVESRRLIEFCGLAWDDRCLKFHETERTVATASNVQVRQPLYRSSLERWRRYEAHLGPLLAELETQAHARQTT